MVNLKECKATSLIHYFVHQLYSKNAIHKEVLLHKKELTASSCLGGVELTKPYSHKGCTDLRTPVFCKPLPPEKRSA